MIILYFFSDIQFFFQNVGNKDGFSPNFSNYCCVPISKYNRVADHRDALMFGNSFQHFSVLDLKSTRQSTFYIEIRFEVVQTTPPLEIDWLGQMAGC